jgi:hypothetical protein
MQVIDCIQGSPEWLSARLGIITASEMDNVMSNGKARLTYMYKLIAERVTGEPTGQPMTADMERGHLWEPEARQLYVTLTGDEVSETGFIRNHDDLGGVGYSPDGLVGKEGLLEIKTRKPHLQAEILITGNIPNDHEHQCHTGLWVTEREWIDYVSYCPGLPLFRQRIERRHVDFDKMHQAVFDFYGDLEEKMQTIINA